MVYLSLELIFFLGSTFDDFIVPLPDRFPYFPLKAFDLRFIVALAEF